MLFSGVITDKSYEIGVASNCSCDLTPFKCDTYCCCDSDCEDVATKNFNLSCVSGLSGRFCRGIFREKLSQTLGWDPGIPFQSLTSYKRQTKSSLDLGNSDVLGMQYFCSVFSKMVSEHAQWSV